MALPAPQPAEGVPTDVREELGGDRGRLRTTLSFWLGVLSLVSYILRTQTNTVSSLPCFLWSPCSLPPVSQVGKKEKKVKSLSRV